LTREETGGLTGGLTGGREIAPLFNSL